MMMKSVQLVLHSLFLWLCAGVVLANPVHHHGHHAMTITRDAIVMNTNTRNLPDDCDSISTWYKLTVKAGKQFARDFADKQFAYDTPTINVEPCSLIDVTFINTDEVRHQWMVHGLPRYLYPKGMFHLEAMGGKSATGSFIVPSDNQTYLVHCDMAQHMEKGMKAQLVVGEGSGDLWSIPGVSGSPRYLNDRQRYPPWIVVLMSVLAAGSGCLAYVFLTTTISREKPRS